MKDNPAPAFTLPSQDDKNVSLGDYKGQWVVLYFYPKDDTPGCTTEACEFTDALPDFKDLDAAILGVSADSPASHRKFIEKYDLKITLLSDTDRDVMKAYGAYGEKKMYGKSTMGVIRSTVLIDPDGVVREHWKNVKAQGHADKVRARLQELRG